jgi:site-specific DNA-methyltransferase (adenine-specific)
MSLPNPYYQDDGIVIYNGDCREIMSDLPKVDLVLTDPPYGVELANWDRLPVQRDLDLCREAAPSVVWFGAAPSRCMKAILALVPVCDRIFVWNRKFALLSTGGSFWHFQPIYTWGKPPALGSDVVIVEEWDDVGRVHPAQKPESLMKRLCGDAESILDPFMGSGTTLRAAKDLGRRAIGIEEDERYCEIAAKRMQQEALTFEGKGDR